MEWQDAGWLDAVPDCTTLSMAKHCIRAEYENGRAGKPPFGGAREATDEELQYKPMSQPRSMSATRRQG